jgi:hypothetical protein
MARILALNPPYNGMSTIVNVLGRVGSREQNSPDDVRVVQRLLQMCSRGQAFSSSVGAAQPTGHFDAVTGFWIFWVQDRVRALISHSQIVDGVVSPAHGTHYSPGGGIWTIVQLNESAKSNSATDYAAYLDECTRSAT